MQGCVKVEFLRSGRPQRRLSQNYRANTRFTPTSVPKSFVGANLVFARTSHSIHFVEVEYPMQGVPLEEKTPYTDIKLARTVHLRYNRETAVYHLFINMTP